MAEAIFGLIGVVVGAVLTSGFELLRLWLDRRAQLKQACRLLEPDLNKLVAVAEMGAEQATVASGALDRFLRIPDAWETHRAALAHLSDQEWTAMNVVVLRVEQLIASREIGGLGASQQGYWKNLRAEVEELRTLLRRRTRRKSGRKSLANAEANAEAGDADSLA